MEVKIALQYNRIKTLIGSCGCEARDKQKNENKMLN